MKGSGGECRGTRGGSIRASAGLEPYTARPATTGVPLAARPPMQEHRHCWQRSTGRAGPQRRRRFRGRGRAFFVRRSRQWPVRGARGRARPAQPVPDERNWPGRRRRESRTARRPSHPTAGQGQVPGRERRDGSETSGGQPILACSSPFQVVSGAFAAVSNTANRVGKMVHSVTYCQGFGSSLQLVVVLRSRFVFDVHT